MVMGRPQAEKIGTQFFIIKLGNMELISWIAIGIAIGIIIALAFVIFQGDKDDDQNGDPPQPKGPTYAMAS